MPYPVIYARKSRHSSHTHTSLSPNIYTCPTSDSRDTLLALPTQRPQPSQLNHGFLQHSQLLRSLLPLDDRLRALGSDARDNVVGQLAYHFGVQDAWQLLEQAPLDGQGADRVDDRLQRCRNFGCHQIMTVFHKYSIGNYYHSSRAPCPCVARVGCRA